MNLWVIICNTVIEIQAMKNLMQNFEPLLFTNGSTQGPDPERQIADINAGVTPDGNMIKEIFKFGSDREIIGPSVRTS